MEDKYSRQIKYLRLSVTDRCNLRCQYCMPPEGIEKQSHAAILRNEDYVQVVKVMAGLGVEKIRLTGGEPLVRKGLSNLVRQLSQIKGIKEVSLTTNGLLLEEQLDDLIEAGLKRINISLDSLRPEVYKTLSRGGDLSAVLRGIELCRQKGLFPIKLNVVVIGGVNTDEIDDFIALTDEGLEVRFIELMPLGEAAQWSKDKFVNLSQLLAKRKDLVPDPSRGDGGPCRYYRRLDKPGYVGVINPISDHFCQSCNRLRLTAEGMLRTCLHSNEELDLRPFLQDENRLQQAILQAVETKPEKHLLHSEHTTLSTRNMNAIGG